MIRKPFAIIIALSGISFVILIHEMGHLLAAKFYGVSAPVFSIGFGPTLAGIQWGDTFYQIALLPLGGYVSLNISQLNMQPFSTQAIIILSGIAINLLFAYGLFAWFSFRGLPAYKMMQSLIQEQGITSQFIGPIGVISLFIASATRGIDYLLVMLAAISFSIGLFNLLPIPFLDGNQLVGFAYHALQESFPENTYGNMLIIILAGILLFYLVRRLTVPVVR